MKRFDELSVNEIRAGIERGGAGIGVAVIGEGLMPEADVLLCRVGGRHFAIRCDLAYGSELRFNDDATPAEVGALEAALLQLCTTG